MKRLGIHSFVWTGGGTQDELERALDRSAECGYKLIEFAYLRPENSTSTAWARRPARSTSRSPSPWACLLPPTCRAPTRPW